MSRLIVTTSWDDGDTLDVKLSRLLTKYGLKGTFYIGQSHKRIDPLRREDVQEIAKEHEIGAHTLNHVHLTRVPLPEAKAQIEDSKAWTEEVLGREVDMFSYPYGEYNREVEEIVRNCGFIGARTCDYAAPDAVTDPFRWGVTLGASNRSPLITLKTWLKSRISIRSLLDWRIRSELLFDLALDKGGVWHLWGHSWEIDKDADWDKLERVLAYVGNRTDVLYATNAEALRRSTQE
jgi:peptidoglycan/xylan/chitin deacetylase (PgdA/CDA1 family)